ncbi:MAG: riboflavin synthase, partial [Armatimonadota bacterium]
LRFDGQNLTVQVADAWPGDPLDIGESIAVDGCCLTLVSDSGGLTFEISPETLSRTIASGYKEGMHVNLERAMKASDRFGGHIVQGHVDRVGNLVSKRMDRDWWVFTFECAPEDDKYLIDKGSVAVDGVSLTVVLPRQGQFNVALIPHTLKQTNLGELFPGDPVNLEFDVLAKHIEKLLPLSK